MDRLKELKEQIKETSESKFGKRKGTQAKGPLNHLKLEVDELLEVLGKGGEEEEEEWADCLLLLLDAWRIRYGNWTSYNKFLDMAFDKLEVIKNREYNSEPDENGVFSRPKKESGYVQFMRKYEKNIFEILQDYVMAMNNQDIRNQIARRISNLTQMLFIDTTEEDEMIKGIMKFESDEENEYNEKITLNISVQ